MQVIRKTHQAFNFLFHRNRCSAERENQKGNQWIRRGSGSPSHRCVSRSQASLMHVHEWLGLNLVGYFYVSFSESFKPNTFGAWTSVTRVCLRCIQLAFTFLNHVDKETYKIVKTTDRTHFALWLKDWLELVSDSYNYIILFGALVFQRDLSRTTLQMVSRRAIFISA